MQATNFYLTYLHQEGYQPRSDQANGLWFKRQGLTYLIQTDANDPQFVHLLLPDLWQVGSPEEHTQVLGLLNQVNATLKVVKGVLVDSQVWVSLEAFLADPADFAGLLQRGFGLMDCAVESLLGQLKSGGSHAEH